MKMCLLKFLTGYVFFSLISCGNYVLLKKNVKEKTLKSFVLARIDGVDDEGLDVLVIQSWLPKVLINEVHDDKIIVGDYLNKDIVITFSLEDYLDNQSKDCEYCIERLYLKEVKLDELSKGMLSKRSRKRLNKLKKGDLVLIALNKRQVYFLSDLFQFNKYNYNFLEKELNPCLRSDFGRLN